MSQSKHSKGTKRKSEAAGSSEVKVRLTEPSSSVGPVFANFPSVRPAASIPFTLYTRDVGSSEPLAKQHTILAGETEDVEFFSHNRDRSGASEGGDCQYLPAVYDPATGTLDIHTSAPLYLLAHRVKRLRTAALTGTQRAADYRARRNDLGEAFGTKKAKSQIRAEERNKVDIGAMQSIKGHLMEMIGEKEAEDDAGAPSELIPKPDTTTTEPLLVYPRDSLLPDAEFSSIDASSLLKAKDDRARAGLLPWRRSRFVEEKLRMAAHSSAPSSSRKQTARMAYYLAALLAFNDLSPRLSKLGKSDLPGKLPGVPTQIIHGMLERFSEPVSKRHVVSEKMKTKLLAYICVLYLILDECSTDVSRVARELNLLPNKVADMYKGLGCKVDIPTPAEREKLGISLAEARANRRAILKAPVVFPKQRTRAPARR